MAKETSLVCDACGSRREVWSLHGVRSDHMNVDVDLCKKCWGTIMEGYGVTVSRRSTRRNFQVIDERDIE